MLRRHFDPRGPFVARKPLSWKGLRSFQPGDPFPGKGLDVSPRDIRVLWEGFKIDVAPPAEEPAELKRAATA